MTLYECNTLHADKYMTIHFCLCDVDVVIRGLYAYRLYIKDGHSD